MLQNIIAFGVIAIAGGYLARRWYLALRSAFSNKAGCAGGCGCAMASAPPPAPNPNGRSLPILKKS